MVTNQSINCIMFIILCRPNAFKGTGSSRIFFANLYARSVKFGGRVVVVYKMRKGKEKKSEFIFSLVAAIFKTKFKIYIWS